MKILEIIDKDLYIIKEDKILLEKINMRINSGDNVLISGINGAGKSTLFKCLIPNNEETVYAEFRNGNINFPLVNNYSDLNQHVIDIRQEDFLGKPSFFLKVEDVLLYGLQSVANPKKYLLDWIDKYKPFIKDDIDKKLLKKRITSLSGGEKKYIAILQGLVRCDLHGISLALIDEPVNNLDAKHIVQLSDLLLRIQYFNPNFAYIIITHCHVFPYINKAFEIRNKQIIEVEYQTHNCFGTYDANGYYQSWMNPETNWAIGIKEIFGSGIAQNKNLNSKRFLGNIKCVW